MMKRITAMILVLVLTLGMGVLSFAETSPGEVVTPANPNYDPKTHLDVETADNGVQVTFYINGSTSTVVDVQATGSGTTVNAYGGYDENRTYVPAIQVGDGTHGVMNSKKGQKIKTFAINNGDNLVTFKKYAFKGSKASKVKVNGQKSKFEKNAFKGTKKANAKIYLKKAKTAKDITVAKGAFNGLNNKSTIYVSKKNMSKKEYNKLVKKLRKAGYKGKIVRN